MLARKAHNKRSRNEAGAVLRRPAVLVRDPARPGPCRLRRRRHGRGASDRPAHYRGGLRQLARRVARHSPTGSPARPRARSGPAHPISGRDGMLRASNYYRAAEFFLHGDPNDPRIKRSYERSVACFRRRPPASRRRRAGPRPLRRRRPPRLLLPTPARASGPPVIMHNGFDGSAEEMHFFGAAAAAERGYNVLSFEDPASRPPATRRAGVPPGLGARRRPGARLGARARRGRPRVSLLGTAWEASWPPAPPRSSDRLAACIGGRRPLRPRRIARARASRATGSSAESLLRADNAPGSTPRWRQTMAPTRPALGHHPRNVRDGRRRALGGSPPATWTTPCRRYRGEDPLPDPICEAEEDSFFQGQPEAVYNHLTCPQTLMRFTGAEGAGAHCHSGAQRLAFGRIYDWLDDTLRHLRTRRDAAVTRLA